MSRPRKTVSASTNPSVQVLLLTQNAEVKEAKLITAADGTITIAMLQALLKKKEAPEVIGSYKYKSQTLFLVGYTKGKAGHENKHELPPPHDTILCFGDMILMASKDAKTWKTPVSFKASDYEAFYTKAYGGFEELGSEDEEEEEDVAEEDADGGVVEEEEEEVVEEEEEEEEEEAEEDVEEDGGDAGDVEEDVPPPTKILRVPKTKKPTKRAAAAAAASAAQVYTTYLHVPEEDEVKREGPDVPITSVPQRRRKIRILLKLFDKYLNEPECVKLERCIYNATLHVASQRHVGKLWSHPPFVELYDMITKHICANFHPDSYVGNNELFDRYKRGYLTFEQISEMDPYQLFEGRWHESFVNQQIREKRQLEGNKAMATDRFLCSRCHKRECTYYEMQTRSADEPMTIFVTCLNCGKHWRQ
jgi:DNA-directed RNA polymerase subunit M/transcription elongation factor TFIIS